MLALERFVLRWGQNAKLQFTFNWTDAERWEGRNFTVKLAEGPT